MIKYPLLQVKIAIEFMLLIIRLLNQPACYSSPFHLIKVLSFVNGEYYLKLAFTTLHQPICLNEDVDYVCSRSRRLAGIHSDLKGIKSGATQEAAGSIVFLACSGGHNDDDGGEADLPTWHQKTFQTYYLSHFGVLFLNFCRADVFMLSTEGV